jgi:hypothetical protein
MLMLLLFLLLVAVEFVAVAVAGEIMPAQNLSGCQHPAWKGAHSVCCGMLAQKITFT